MERSLETRQLKANYHTVPRFPLTGALPGELRIWCRSRYDRRLEDVEEGPSATPLKAQLPPHVVSSTVPGALS